MPYDPLAAPRGADAAWALSPESDAAWNDLLKSMLLRQAVQAGDLNLQQQQMWTDQMQGGLQPPPPMPDTGTAGPGLDYAAEPQPGGMRAPYPGEKLSDYVKAKDRYDAEMRKSAEKANQPKKAEKTPPEEMKRYTEFLKAIAPKPNKLEPGKPIVLPQATREEIAKAYGYKNLEEAMAKRNVSTPTAEKAAAKVSEAPSPAKAAEDPYAMFPHQPWIDNMMRQGMTPDEIINKVVTPMPAITPAQKVARQQAFMYLDAKRNEMTVSVPPAPPTQFPGRPDTGSVPPSLEGFMPLDVRMGQAAQQQAQPMMQPPVPPVPPATSGMMPQSPSTTVGTGDPVIDGLLGQGKTKEEIRKLIQSSNNKNKDQLLKLLDTL